MAPKNKDVLLSGGVFITLTISFIFMLCFFIPSLFAASSNQITDAEAWIDNSDMYGACLFFSSIIYIVTLLLQYGIVKSRKVTKERRGWRRYITISNTLFVLLIVSFLILSLIVWYRIPTVGIPDPSCHGGATLPWFRSSLFALVTDLIIPITLTVVGIILSIAQYFQLSSSPVKNKSVTPK